jgi:hypothetical protein
VAFCSCEVGAEAVVDAGCEAERGSYVSGDVEAVGVGASVREVAFAGQLAKASLMIRCNAWHRSFAQGRLASRRTSRTGNSSSDFTVHLDRSAERGGPASPNRGRTVRGELEPVDAWTGHSALAGWHTSVDDETWSRSETASVDLGVDRSPDRGRVTERDVGKADNSKWIQQEEQTWDEQ